MINDNLIAFRKILKEEISIALEPINEKIDVLQKDVSGLKQDVSGLKQDVSGLKQDVSGLKKDVDQLQKDMDGVKETQEKHTGFLMEIETKLNVYNDMYEINRDHIQRLNKRVIRVEDSLEIEPSDELLIPVK